MQSALVHVGTVGRPHGVRGEMKVIPETGDPRLFEEQPAFFVGSSEEQAKRIEVESVRFQHVRGGVVPLLKLKGYDTPEEVGLLRGQLLMADRDQIGLADDEALAFELVGLSVVTEDGTLVGKVTDVLESPAHDLYQVQTLAGSTVLIPGVSEFIKEVDLESGRVMISPIEGLLD